MNDLKTADNYYSGTSGLLLPVRNKLFYPEEFKDKSRLCYYSSLMNSIEINSSFYKVPRAATVHKWTEEVGDEFKFTFKLPKDITHQKGLVFSPEAVDHFMSVIALAGDQKGSLLIQFPPGLKISSSREVEQLLLRIRQNDVAGEWHTAVEFRHPSFYHEDVYDLLDEQQMAMVIHDKPPAITPIRDNDSNFEYLRFHGPGGNYRGSYPDDVLMEYAEYIRDWLSEGRTIYTYFNNTMGEAIHNLETLRNFVRASG